MYSPDTSNIRNIKNEIETKLSGGQIEPGGGVVVDSRFTSASRAELESLESRIRGNGHDINIVII